ncbi:sialate O-acetylesterase [Puia sp.]|uniref:sialate O-acetylesterase n=1 Tax=Puia sp. TaxID=2045100 RepID=UPI002F41B281
MRNRILFGIALMLFCSASIRAEVTLPAVIADSMVLQQKSEVALWGWAKGGTRIIVTPSWDHHPYTTVAAGDGSWRVRVATPAAGGPYTISFDDGKKKVLREILIGEVWICSGQSNMEMPVKGFGNQPVLHSTDLLMDSRNPQIRLFRLERAMSRKPETECKATGWQPAGVMSVRDFSAVGYQYAKILQEKLKVPVGMIMTTWGGTVVEAWMNQHSLGAFPEIKVLGEADTAKINKNEPTVLYNAMVQPLVGFGIRGVIWYQGEQNRPNAAIYDRLLAAMVKEWREEWKCGEWPFYYVQIAPYAYNDKLGPAAPLREAQQRALALIPRSGMVVSMDVGDEHSIHPANKTVIPQRLACWALADTYGWAGLPHASPVYQRMRVSGDTVIVGFDNVPNGLTTFGRPIAGFEIAGEDRRFFPAKARIVSRGVQLLTDSVKAPVAVRYAFKDWIMADLFNTEGLPVAPFRTDSW